MRRLQLQLQLDGFCIDEVTTCQPLARQTTDSFFNQHGIWKDFNFVCIQAEQVLSLSSRFTVVWPPPTSRLGDLAAPKRHWSLQPLGTICLFAGLRTLPSAGENRRDTENMHFLSLRSSLGFNSEEKMAVLIRPHLDNKQHGNLHSESLLS